MTDDLTTGQAAGRAAPRGLGDMRCLVIGAASGIGAATVERLRGRMLGVVGADLTSATGASAAPVQVRVDVTDEQSVAAAVDAAADLVGGPLDAVVNTAGVLGTVQPSTDERVEDFEHLLRVNLTGAYIVSRAVLPAMSAHGFGRLVHFASTAGKEGVVGMCGYSASKAGVIALTKSLAREYARTGVTVNAVAPGKVATPLVGDGPISPADLARIPMGRLGRAEEAAALVEYIVSPGASYTTGSVFDLSGGRATY